MATVVVSLLSPYCSTLGNCFSLPSGFIIILFTPVYNVARTARGTREWGCLCAYQSVNPFVRVCVSQISCALKSCLHAHIWAHFGETGGVRGDVKRIVLVVQIYTFALRHWKLIVKTPPTTTTTTTWTTVSCEVETKLDFMYTLKPALATSPIPHPRKHAHTAES